MSEIEELRSRLRDAEALLHERSEEIAFLRLHLDVMALTDGITGLLNANGVRTAITGSVQRLDRLLEPFVVTAIRIPALHAAIAESPDEIGDCIRRVAAMIKSCIRAVDAAGRLDDETFVIVASLPAADHHLVALGRLGALLRRAPLQTSHGTYAVEPRFGVVAARPGSIVDGDGLLALALKAVDAAGAGDPVLLDC